MKLLRLFSSKMDTTGLELLVLVLICLGHFSFAQFTVSPGNLVAQSNTAVTLVCETDPTSSSRNIAWSRSDGVDNFELIAVDGDIETGFEGRYSVVYQSRTGVGSPTTSRSELTIEDVQAREAGTYYCNYLTFDAYSQLIVIESEPQTSSNVTSLDTVIEGETIGLECFVSYSSAISWPPLIIWREASAGDLTAIDQSTAGEARFVYAAPVTRTDHGNSYQCTAEWGVIPEDEIPEALRGDHDPDAPDYLFSSNALGLSVLYPVENLDINPRKSVYNPGESISITAAGRPDVNFRWQSLIDNTTIEEPLLPITAAMEGLQNWTYLAYNTLRGQEYPLSDSISFLVEIPTTTTPTPTPSTVSTTAGNPGETTSVTPAGKSLKYAQQNDNPGLSGGAIAGIVIGCLAAFILIILLIYCCISRNKAPKTTKDKNKKANNVDAIRQPPQQVLSPGDIAYIDEKGPPGGPPPYNPYAPFLNGEWYHYMLWPMNRNPEGLMYADLALDDTPRSRKPIQLYDNMDLYNLTLSQV